MNTKIPSDLIERPNPCIICQDAILVNDRIAVIDARSLQTGAHKRALVHSACLRKVRISYMYPALAIIVGIIAILAIVGILVLGEQDRSLPYMLKWEAVYAGMLCVTVAAYVILRHIGAK